MFGSILSKGNFTQKHEIVFLITKWSKFTDATLTETLKILESSRFEWSIIGPSLLAELISTRNSTSTSMKNENCKDEVELASSPQFNVYVNAVDEKTGAVGYGLSKPNDFLELDGLPTLSDFHTANSSVTSICKVGTKIYCLETDIGAKK